MEFDTASIGIGRVNPMARSKIDSYTYCNYAVVAAIASRPQVKMRIWSNLTEDKMNHSCHIIIGRQFSILLLTAFPFAENTFSS